MPTRPPELTFIKHMCETNADGIVHFLLFSACDAFLSLHINEFNSNWPTWATMRQPIWYGMCLNVLTPNVLGPVYFQWNWMLKNSAHPANWMRIVTIRFLGTNEAKWRSERWLCTFSLSLSVFQALLKYWTMIVERYWTRMVCQCTNMSRYRLAHLLEFGSSHSCMLLNFKVIPGDFHSTSSHGVSLNTENYTWNSEKNPL